MLMIKGNQLKNVCLRETLKLNELRCTITKMIFFFRKFNN